jgi:RNA polymerase sigma factor (sigma-70 family)
MKGGRVTLLDRIQSEALAPPDDATQTLRREVDTMLRRLLPRQAFVIRKRFGLGGEPPCTQKEVAAMLGISNGRVSEIERQALAKLRFVTNGTKARQALGEIEQDI